MKGLHHGFPGSCSFSRIFINFFGSHDWHSLHDFPFFKMEEMVSRGQPVRNKEGNAEKVKYDLENTLPSNKHIAILNNFHKTNTLWWQFPNCCAWMQIGYLYPTTTTGIISVGFWLGVTSNNSPSYLRGPLSLSVHHQYRDALSKVVDG